MSAFSLGVGFTNACDLDCAHCYRHPGTDALTVAQVLAAADALPLRSVNFGTGENGLHPDFPVVVDALLARGVAVTMTTNGYSARRLPDALLARLKEVEFSVDFPAEAAHDAERGPGNWALIEQQMGRCRALGVRVTVTAVMMARNVDEMVPLLALAGARGALLRVNILMPVPGAGAAPEPSAFWRTWQALLDASLLVSCGEPVLRAALGLPRPQGAGCGLQTVRLTPRGVVKPCVYGPDGDLRLADLVRLGPRIVDTPSFRDGRETVPAACAGCPALDTCRGGCASRRARAGDLAGRDPYCPFLGAAPYRLHATRDTSGLALHKASATCTTILRPRVG